MLKENIEHNPFIKFFIIIAGGLILSFMGSCGTAETISKKPVVENNLIASKQQAVSIYQIQPGDQLDIKFYYNNELDNTVLVRPDGKISLQLVGDIEAAGFTPSRLSKIISEHYENELRKPEVTVIVKSFRPQQIYVGGEVEKAGPIEYRPDITALQAIIAAGGFKETAKPEEILVIRKEDNRLVPYRLNLQQASVEPSKADFLLQPYDVIYVSKSFIAEANKFVKQYIADLLLFRGWSFSFGNLNIAPNSNSGH